MSSLEDDDRQSLTSFLFTHSIYIYTHCISIVDYYY